MSMFPVAKALVVTSSTIVYVTDTGTKYHRKGCPNLKTSNPMSLRVAEGRGYTPCSICHPDTETGVYNPQATASPAPVTENANLIGILIIVLLIAVASAILVCGSSRKKVRQTPHPELTKAATTKTLIPPGKEQIYLIEDKDGFLVRVPASKLESWSKAQAEPPRPLNKMEERAKAEIIKRLSQGGKGVQSEAKQKTSYRSTEHIASLLNTATCSSYFSNTLVYKSLSNENSQETIVRLQRAQTQELPLLAPITVVTKIQSSTREGTYTVTLDSCTCKDFQIRHRPCKHMLKLALEIGLLLPIKENPPASHENTTSNAGAGEDDSRVAEQFECDHSCSEKEQLLHVCPVCGVISPYEQRTCDCGYGFDTAKTSPNEKVDLSQTTKAPMRSRIAIISLTVALLAVSIGLLVGWCNTQQQLSTSQANLNAAETQIEKLKESIEILVAENTGLTKEINNSSAEIEELKALLEDLGDDIPAAYFLRNHIGFIVSGSNYYHNYECSIFQDADEVWAHNTEYCQYLGYSKCPLCW